MHLNPISPVWFELGTARHSELTATPGKPIDATAITEAVEAYSKALTICPSKRDDISRRLQHLHTLRAGGSEVPEAAASSSADVTRARAPTPGLKSRLACLPLPPPLLSHPTGCHLAPP